MSDRISQLANDALKSFADNEQQVRSEFAELVSFVQANFKSKELYRDGSSVSWGLSLEPVTHEFKDNVHTLYFSVRSFSGSQSITKPILSVGRDYGTGRYAFWSEGERRKFFRNREEVEQKAIMALKERNAL
ncbi:MAG: hypothetical protein QE284_18605 [Rhizobium sp.]|nr:hypothetical protein [Rhizobium sp.]